MNKNSDIKNSPEETKPKEKCQEPRKAKPKTKWFNFFTKWFFIGLILVLFSICISLWSQQMPNDSLYGLKPILTIVSAMLSTIGIALFVGCVFDFSKNSEAFVGFVSNILSDIVVSKNFLSTLEKSDKEQALNLILKPMDSQVEQYANINNFFKKKIRESMTMFDTNFKTNVVLNVEAHKNLQKNFVYCETTATYTIYKLNNKFEPLKIMLEKDQSETSNVRVISPDGQEFEITNMIEQSTLAVAGIEYKVLEAVLPEQCEKYDHLTIKRTISEPGHDHWICYYWQSLTPYEGISCRINCYDGLTVKDYMVFDNKAYYVVEPSADKTKMDITSSQWLDEDTGFCLVISE